MHITETADRTILFIIKLALTVGAITCIACIFHFIFFTNSTQVIYQACKDASLLEEHGMPVDETFVPAVTEYASTRKPPVRTVLEKLATEYQSSDQKRRIEIIQSIQKILQEHRYD
jgi:hypothetical protein